MEKALVTKTLRVPAVTAAAPADGALTGAAVARQMDAVLLDVGFKASGALLRHLSGLPEGIAMDRALLVIGAVRELVGDNVAHNAYFVDFPRNVPDTMEFWVSLLRKALVGPRLGRAGDVPDDEELLALSGAGPVDLLRLPTYGTYQHTYAELLDAHDELIRSAKDRVTVVHLGAGLAEEQHSLYLELAGSAIPLPDTVLLAELARVCVSMPQPDTIPVRNHRAAINAARIEAGHPVIAVDTVTDVLRVACRLSGGDETLVQPTRFVSLPRAQRRALMAALDAVVRDAPSRLGDVRRYSERWKRLGERLHPEEVGGDGAPVYGRFDGARQVFRVARGEVTVPSPVGEVEQALAGGDVQAATRRLSVAPGRLARSLDHLLRLAGTDGAGDVVAAFGKAAGAVSGRVLLSLWEHLENRVRRQRARVFANRGRRAWVTADGRDALDRQVVADIVDIIWDEIIRRLPKVDTLVVDAAVLPVALPLSGNATEDGFAIMPRGSRFAVEGDTLRFFTYWRQQQHRTDFDLSALFLDRGFHPIGHVSYTNYRYQSARHSGDITSAPQGATEFIDVPLASLDAAYIVPQINIYDGEGFDEVAEAMLGFMVRDAAQAGLPFEPRTVRMRSDLRGRGKVALPLVFESGGDGLWFGKWMHLYLRGEPTFNRVEGNRADTALLARSIVERKYLTVQTVIDLMIADAKQVVIGDAPVPGFVTGPVTYVGLSEPDGLPEGSTAITLGSLNKLIPE